MKKALSWTLLSAVLLICVACSRQIYRPNFSGEVVSDKVRDDFVKRILSYKEEALSFRCLSHAKNDIHGEKGTLRYALLFERPDKLRSLWL
jgi:hypothetical protein